jgi:hypothetical protein
VIPENREETENVILPKRGTVRHNAQFELGMVKKINFHQTDLDYCKSQILMAFTDQVPDFRTKMENFMFYHSSGNGTILVEAPPSRISPTDFTIDDLNTYISINLSLLIIYLVSEVVILVQKRYTSALDIHIPLKHFMMSILESMNRVTRVHLIRNPIMAMMKTRVPEIVFLVNLKDLIS